MDWKKLPETKWAFNHLDELIDPLESNEKSQTYMEAILEKVFPNSSPSNDLTAFTMAVVGLFLDHIVVQ